MVAMALLMKGSVVACAASLNVQASAPLPVRVVVVTTFELGHDSGDLPGEFQNWVEKLPLSEGFPAPGMAHEVLRYNPNLHVLGVVSGEGPTHMAEAMTALSLDPRFDLHHAYFVLAGIAGIDPRAGTVATAAWAEHVVNGGIAHLIDAREIPSSWSDGFTPVQGSTPDERPRPPIHSIAGDMLFTLKPSLVQWAYRLTQNVILPDNQKLIMMRQPYKNFPHALDRAHVIMGDTLSTEIFWVGARMNDWAERWVRYWTDGQGRMATTAEEDVALCQALTLQGKSGRVDPQRILILRTASNFDMPPPGRQPASMLVDEEHEENFAGLYASTDSAYRVASPVVKELATHWGYYETHVP
ncbi:purine nucleoside permease [Saccharibacter sp. 17.LH.SD]|uniref:purine-nucleoside phosphorylase n=1 Tax=Saccharibacter sp. 17.LH.SD TaxID=2689393 RepID=UPI001F410BD9|nr:purine nucleoside permease [Saccharibacter sp. 17.LH.SD]